MKPLMRFRSKFNVNLDLFKLKKIVALDPDSVINMFVVLAQLDNYLLTPGNDWGSVFDDAIDEESEEYEVVQRAMSSTSMSRTSSRDVINNAGGRDRDEDDVLLSDEVKFPVKQAKDNR